MWRREPEGLAARGQGGLDIPQRGLNATVSSSAKQT